MQIGYVNVFVRDIEAAVAFYGGELGLTAVTTDTAFGYASFEAGAVSLGLAQTDDESIVGRHTGVVFVIDDIDSAYADLSGKGVEFEMPPTEQPWGGTLALFKDPDGNVYYLDPGHSGHAD